MRVPTVRSARLDLVSMSAAFMAASLAGRRGEAAAALGAALPSAWPADVTWLLDLRLSQIRADPAMQPWLLRAMVRRTPSRLMVGYIGFHGAPDPRGSVEIGYTVLPEHRRQGYASEAAEALMDWASDVHQIRHFVASVSPGNAPSLALVRKLGFSQTGTQSDDIDGEELVFELLRDKRNADPGVDSGQPLTLSDEGGMTISAGSQARRIKPRGE